MSRKKALIISLPNPCGENWNSMNSTKKGKFCESCQKEVIDFTKMTDEGILKFISQNNSKFCGMFSKKQLNREISSPNKPHFPNYKKFAASLLAILSFKFSHSQVSQKVRTETVISPSSFTSSLETRSINPKEYIISGKVNAERSVLLLLEKVTIIIGNNEYTTETDSLGNYKLFLDGDKIKEYTIVVFTHPLLRREVRSIHKSNFPAELNVFMADTSEGLMGVPIFDENGNIAH